MEQEQEPISFETSPDRYRHWRLELRGDAARLIWDVQESRPLRPGYVLKLNSYDLGVDIELADAVQRLRFEHPEVRALAVVSGKDRVFSAGANIHMLASSSHAFKVNFCKFTNETRLAMEEASAQSGQRYLAACGGVTAGGGYELAAACDEILLVDDGSSAVSLPEVPLLGVLPGTGGLTRLVDKRSVRRDHADIFCTTAEGIKGQRAVDWRLVDAIAPKSRFDGLVGERLARLAASDWLAREVILLAARTLRRLDVTARSLFALAEPGSCFAGSILEAALAADRTYALDDPARPVRLALSPLNFGALPMGHGVTRLQTRLPRRSEEIAALAKRVGTGEPVRFDARAATEAGLVTIAADEIDYDDEVRLAVEERTSLSPDALTGMEASLRFPGAESMGAKIFGRLSAWQNWIFQRPNAVGDHGALKCYGKPERPSFDWKRT